MFGAEAEGRQRVYLHKNLHIHLAACIFFDVEWFSPHGGTVHLHEINYVFLHLVVGFFLFISFLPIHSAARCTHEKGELCKQRQ